MLRDVSNLPSRNTIVNLTFKKCGHTQINVIHFFSQENMVDFKRNNRQSPLVVQIISIKQYFFLLSLWCRNCVLQSCLTDDVLEIPDRKHQWERERNSGEICSAVILRWVRQSCRIVWDNVTKPKNVMASQKIYHHSLRFFFPSKP